MKSIIDKMWKKVSVDSVKQIFSDPQSVRAFFGSIKAAYRKDRMNVKEERKKMPSKLSKLLKVKEEKVRKYKAEIENSEKFYDRFDKKVQHLKNNGLYSGTTSRTDAQTIYIVTRITKPNIAVETGCLYGSFDAHITLAMKRNGYGTLHSIELPDEDKEYGYLITNECEDHWNLHMGNSKNILPSLLKEIGKIDMFLHDSLHRKKHMRWEFNEAVNNIRNNGVLASHDVLNSRVFQAFAENNGMDWCRVRNTGVSVK
jgi:predicted O-methyltransferase YrrM